MHYLKIIKAFVATNRRDPLTGMSIDIQIKDNHTPDSKRHVVFCVESPLDNPNCDVIIIDGNITIKTFAYWRDKRWLLKKVTRRYDYRGVSGHYEILLDPVPMPGTVHTGRIGAKA